MIAIIVLQMDGSTIFFEQIDFWTIIEALISELSGAIPREDDMNWTSGIIKVKGILTNEIKT